MTRRGRWGIVVYDYLAKRHFRTRDFDRDFVAASWVVR